MHPATDGMGSHGGYCGPAVKPIALHMVAEIARTPETSAIPISGIGGIGDWRDAVDFLALGASNLQVCTAAMVYGFKIIDDLTEGLSDFLDQKGMQSVAELVGKAVPSVTDWQYLNLNHVEKAVINQDLCIQCGRCHIVCEDTSHQAITHTVERTAKIRGHRRRMRWLQSLRQRVPCRRVHHHGAANGGNRIRAPASHIDPNKADWTTHPNNPMRKQS